MSEHQIENVLQALKSLQQSMNAAHIALRKLGTDEALKHAEELYGAWQMTGQWIDELTEPAE